jgi:hypothetical protein
MTANIDSSRLRISTAPDLVLYLRRLAEKHPQDEVSERLFALVKQEAVNPLVIRIWLGVTKSTKALRLALEQDFSISIRLAGIDRLARFWQTGAWKQYWDEIGGSSHISSLLLQFSVVHLKLLLHGLSTGIKSLDAEEKHAILDELLTRVEPSLHPNISRTIEESNSSLLFTFNKPAALDWTLRQRLIDLPLRNPLQHNIIRGFSASMMFSRDLLMEIIKQGDPNAWETCSVLEMILQPLVKNAWKRRRSIPQEQLDSIFKLCFQLLEVVPNQTKKLTFTDGSLFYYTVMSWAMSPAERRASVDSRIALIFARMPYTESWLSSIVPCLKWVRQTLRYRLLQLAFMHFGNKGIDIDKDDHLKSLPSGVKKWPQHLFISLEREKSLKLLQRLQKTMGDEFLHPFYSTRSILHSDTSFGDVAILKGVLGDPKGKLHWLVY